MATSVQNPDELPTVKGKKRPIKVRAHLQEFGETWDLIRPNQIVANQLIGGAEGEINMAYVVDYFKAHVHPDQRDAFMAAAIADDSLAIEDFMDLMNRMTEAVYGQLPSEPS